MTEQLSGVVQVPRRCPGQLSGLVQKLAYESLWGFMLVPACPIEKITLWKGPLLFITGIRKQWSFYEGHSLGPNWDSNLGLRVSTARYPLSANMCTHARTPRTYACTHTHAPHVRMHTHTRPACTHACTHTRTHARGHTHTFAMGWA